MPIHLCILMKRHSSTLIFLKLILAVFLVFLAKKGAIQVITVIVPELRCSKGVLKPLAQQVNRHASFHFDLTAVGGSDKTCTRICVFPFLRVAIQNRTSETFRGKEWCGSIAEARQLVSSGGTRPHGVIYLSQLKVFFFHS
uniref:Secreted protein n=1 Tax=Angiostrongylus cantonensis TaxID=6313 RepID=A0A0K0D298_ANGCA